jgi:hypothetical protein
MIIAEPARKWASSGPSETAACAIIVKTSAILQVIVIPRGPTALHAPRPAHLKRRNRPDAGHKEDMMNKLSILAGLAAIGLTSPVAAEHIFHLDTPFATRGACEVERNALSNDDDALLESFPELFSSPGEVRSFLNMAFKCERNGNDSQWYIVDYRGDVLDSDWFLRRNR